MYDLKAIFEHSQNDKSIVLISISTWNFNSAVS